MAIFTIIVYVVLSPVQYKTQKSSKMMAALNPELKKIQAKYQGKRDQYSMQKMQEETQALYSKYGVSMSGSCLPLLIQLPLLFAVYQVILYIPGYITKVREMFTGLATKIMSIDGAYDLVKNFVSENKMRVNFADVLTQEKMVDFLYALKPAQWAKLEGIGAFSSLKAEMVETAARSTKVNFFLGINISESPMDAIRNGFSSISQGNATALIVVGIIVGILIPVLAWFTQWLNYKLMPQQSAGDAAAAQMQTVNMIMPVFSAFICLTLSMGVGVYWIMGALCRCVQQVIFNRKIGKINIEDMEAAAKEKAAKQQAKNPNKKQAPEKSYQRQQPQQRKQGSNAGSDPRGSRARTIQNTEQYYNTSSDVPANSLTAKANMVRSLNAKNAEKKNSGKK